MKIEVFHRLDGPVNATCEVLDFSLACEIARAMLDPFGTVTLSRTNSDGPIRVSVPKDRTEKLCETVNMLSPG